MELVLKSINTAPLVSQPPQYKEKVASPVEQPPSKMTVEEVQLKEKEGYDYGLMKGNEGWTTVPVKEGWTTVPTLPVPPTEGQLREGGRNSQHDFTNQTHHQGSALPLRFDEEDNRRYSVNPNTKPFCYLPNIDSNSVQEGGFRVLSEAADPRQDTASGGKIQLFQIL